MDTLVKAIPEHLLTLNWFELEEARALSILDDLTVELKELKGKLSPSKVHKCRVVIRRWYSIWEILEVDHWGDENYDRKVKKPLGKINKALGKLRDLDVNINFAEEYQAPLYVLSAWRKKRARIGRKMVQKIAELKPKKVAKNLAEHLSLRAYELERMLLPLPEEEIVMPASEKPFISPLEAASYQHIERFLLEAEAEAKNHAALAKTPVQLHELRLTIKRWRYLLTEFFSVTNIDLVKAQQLLGKHHDLIRLKEMVEKSARKLKGSQSQKEIAECTTRINLELTRLEDEIELVKKALPFGLRPYKVSKLIG